MSVRLGWTCLGVLAVGLVVGGLHGFSAAEDAKPAAKSADAKAADGKVEGAAEKPAAKPAPKLDQAELEKQFAEKLSNVALVGHFTTDGAEGAPHKDTYIITKAAKLNGDLWMFSGIKYGSKDIGFPLVIRVVWAGDTPMMAMDKFAIPGLGSFSFRLMFDGNRYAGTWQHDDHGGHMWGKLERVKAEPAKDAPKGEAKKDAAPKKAE